MGKLIVVTFNLFLLFLFGDVAEAISYIDILAPETGEKNVSFPVTVTIHNDDQDGFSKFYQTFPEGTEVEVDPIDDATVTFKNGELKIIWIEKPKDSPVIIRYNAKITDEATGRYVFSGEYIYVSQGQRKTLPLPKHTVNFGGEELVENDAMQSVRTLTVLEENIYHMKISLTAKDITGFVRLSDEVPEGAIVENIDDNSSSFSKSGDQVKFIWMDFPQGNVIDVIYKVDLTNAVNKDPENIKGKISFLDKGAATTNFISQISQTENVYQEGNLPVKESNTEVIEEVVMEPVKNTNDIVTFSVQVMAAKKIVDDTYFKKVFNYSGDYHIENHKGWVKYSVGSFGQYVAARNHRNQINNQFKFPGPFIIAHRQDERITTQEALMITNQKWIK